MTRGKVGGKAEEEKGEIRRGVCSHQVWPAPGCSWSRRSGEANQPIYSGATGSTGERPGVPTLNPTLRTLHSLAVALPVSRSPMGTHLIIYLPAALTRSRHACHEERAGGRGEGRWTRKGGRHEGGGRGREADT